MSTLSDRLRMPRDQIYIVSPAAALRSMMTDCFEAADELDRLTARVGRDFELLSWAYSKLVHRSFDNMDDALTMDEIKLMLLDDWRARRTGG